MSTDILITVLSWEDRYFSGLENNLLLYNPSMVIVFRYVTNSEWKKDNRVKTNRLLGDKLIEIEIDSAKTNKTWATFLWAFKTYCTQKNVVIDISTMTREAIWLALYNCTVNKCNINYIYYKPKGYSNDWISRDPGRPRLLYKMSGIAQLGTPTLLLVTGGYDIQRLDSLIYNFEPQKTMLFLQDGEDHRNKDNFKNCQELFRTKYSIESMYEYDAYSVEMSYQLILEKLMQKESEGGDSYLNSYNIILNSLGAKTSAITLFNLWLKFPQVALSYIPSREYNEYYSYGLGESYVGKIPF